MPPSRSLVYDSLPSMPYVRCPSMHFFPSDVRIAWQAVDKLELRHLVNCLVFPQLGMRSHANETSGGDLDGKHSHVALGLPRGVSIVKRRSL